ncbi:unnamed protein product, partial [Fusarium langsethiae]
NKYGQTPLFQAVSDDRETIAKLLIDSGKADVNVKDQLNQTLLIIAATRGREGVVRALLESDQVQVCAQDASGDTALMLAVHHNDERIARLLLATGKAGVNIQDDKGYTPLSWAALQGNESMVRLLVEIGHADVDAQDRQKRTPLQRAVSRWNEPLIWYLLEHGAEFDETIRANMKPLSESSQEGVRIVMSAAMRRLTCPYEALSYAWGPGDKPFSITVNDGDFQIGANLHAALGNLRHSTFERIIWVDALCINQEDATEKGQQVQSMAKIYAKANSVIVWLGEAADESDEALREICRAAVKSPTNENDPKNILSLLHRPWFQRIWVLQEVAAARHVLIKCGSTEIDGYAFCYGLSTLKLSYDDCKSLQPFIAPVSDFIRGAILRPRHIESQSGRFSLDIHPLSTLVELYHTRKATDRRDKVYALLGMSSDDPSGAGLSADYTIPWSQVFEIFIKYTLSASVSVKIWDDSEIAVIKGKGLVLGEVSSVERDNAWEDSQKLEITWKNICSELFRTSVWTVPASAKSIQVGDVVYLVGEATNPTIIRPYGTYWIVIMLSLPTGPIELKNTVSHDLRPDVEWFEQLRSVTTHPRDFVVVLDWETHSVEAFANQERTYAKLVDDEVKTNTLMENVHSVNSQANMGFILQDLEKYTASEDHIRRAMIGFQRTMRLVKGSGSASSAYGRNPKVAAVMEAIIDALLQVKGGWLPLKWAAEDGHGLIVKLILMKADPNMVDEEGRTLLSWASEKGYETVVKLLLDTGAVDPDARDRGGWMPLQWAANNGHETVVEILLGTQMADPDARRGWEDLRDSRRTPLLLASEGGHKAVVRVLLDAHEVDMNARDESGGTSLIWAVKNGHNNVVDLLLQTGKVDPNASEDGEVGIEGSRTALMWAAHNRNDEIVKLLLDTGKVSPDAKDNFGRTAISLAAENGDDAIVKLLLGTGKADPEVADKHGRTPLRLAAEGGFENVVQLLLDTNKVDPSSEDKRGQTPLSSAAKNGHEHVVRILAERNELSLQDLARQIPVPFEHEDPFNLQDDAYFEDRCERLFSHVQKWVARFSRAADMRTSRLKDEINDEVASTLGTLPVSELDVGDDDSISGLPDRLLSELENKKIVDRLDKTMLDGTDIELCLVDRWRRRDVFTSLIMTIIREYIFTCDSFGLNQDRREKLQNLEKELVGPPEAISKWRATTLTLLSHRDDLKRQRDIDAEAVADAIFQCLCAILLPYDDVQGHLQSELRKVVNEAADISVEMRAQKAEYVMLPPQFPEHNDDGDIVSFVDFDSSLMNACGGNSDMSYDELQAEALKVRICLFPAVIKKGGDDGIDEEENVIYPAQVLVASKSPGEKELSIIS